MEKFVTDVSFSKMKLSSRRLLLRPFLMSDYKACEQASQKCLPQKNSFDDEIAMYTNMTRDSYKTRISRYSERARDCEIFVFGVFNRRSRAQLGAIDILILNHEIRWANLGYQINNNCWNRGYASEAAMLAIRLAFDYIGVNRIEASAVLDNRPSRKVALKAGMVYEGKRLNFFDQDDYAVYGANRVDYNKR